MPLVTSGVTTFGRQLILSTINNQTYTLYFPTLTVDNVGYIGGVSVVQVDVPIPGVIREENFIKLYTYSTRLPPPASLTGRRWYLQTPVSGLSWQLWN